MKIQLSKSKKIAIAVAAVVAACAITVFALFAGGFRIPDGQPANVSDFNGIAFAAAPEGAKTIDVSSEYGREYSVIYFTGQDMVDGVIYDSYEFRVSVQRDNACGLRHTDLLLIIAPGDTFFGDNRTGEVLMQRDAFGGSGAGTFEMSDPGSEGPVTEYFANGMFGAAIDVPSLLYCSEVTVTVSGVLYVPAGETPSVEITYAEGRPMNGDSYTVAREGDNAMLRGFYRTMQWDMSV